MAYISYIRYKQSHCNVPGCPNKHQARGWCKKHYGLWRHQGDPMRVGIRLCPECRLRNFRLSTCHHMCKVCWHQYIHGVEPGVGRGTPLERALRLVLMLNGTRGCWIWIGVQKEWKGVRKKSGNGAKMRVGNTNVSPRTVLYDHFIGKPRGPRLYARCGEALCMNPYHASSSQRRSPIVAHWPNFPTGFTFRDDRRAA